MNFISNESTVTVPQIVENFTWMFCHFVDFPDNGIDCSEKVCVQCPVQGRYLVGNESFGIPLLYSLWALLILASAMGIVHNVLIILVVHQEGTVISSSYRFLMSFLASSDIIVAVTAASAGTAETSYFGQWPIHKQAVISWCYVSLYLFCVARSASAFATIVICLKHSLIIWCPLEAPRWFTLQKAKLYSVVVLSIALLLGVPRFLSYSLEENTYKDVPSLRDFEVIGKTTPIGEFFYQTMRGFHSQIDFWVPPPTILGLVLLSYWKTKQLSRKREMMTASARSSIKAGKMFLPVAIVCVLTNIFPIMDIFCSAFLHRAFREMYLTLYASGAINSAVNFPIYYFRSKSFQEAARKFIFRK